MLFFHVGRSLEQGLTPMEAVEARSWSLGRATVEGWLGTVFAVDRGSAIVAAMSVTSVERDAGYKQKWWLRVSESRKWAPVIGMECPARWVRGAVNPVSIPTGDQIQLLMDELMRRTSPTLRQLDGWQVWIDSNKDLTVRSSDNRTTMKVRSQ